MAVKSSVLLTVIIYMAAQTVVQNFDIFCCRCLLQRIFSRYRALLQNTMNAITIPLVPHWNLISGSAATPDDGFLYIGHNSVNYVSKISEDFTPVFKTFHTRQRIKCIDCDPDWTSNKYFAALADDNSVQIWDFDESKAKKGHKAHIMPVVGDGYGQFLENVKLCFLVDRTVLSIDSAFLVHYCVSSNTFSKRGRIIPPKYEVSIIKGSSYDKKIFAAGTTRGLILIANLEAEAVVYTLKGHDNEITSLSWMNIKMISTPEKKLQRSKKVFNETIADDIFDIYEYDYLENEFGAPTSVKTVESDNEAPDNDRGKIQDELANENFNFIEACQNLRGDILARKSDDLNESNNSAAKWNDSKQVTLKDCQQKEKYHSSSSCESIQSNEPRSRSNDFSSKEEDEIEIEHSVEVHNAPIPKENKDQQPVMTYLASGSHESIIWIWNTKTGSSVGKLQLKPHSQNTFVEVCWINDKTLVSNSKSGDLQLFTIQEKSVNKFTFKQEKHNFPHRGVVSLCKLKNSDNIWTISMHKEIMCANIIENKVLAKYSCAPSNIAAIRERPDDMNKVAFACADKRIGLINLSNISATNVDIENFSNKIDSTVLDLAWCPDDSYLAFGTSEGRIGVIDAEKPSNVPVAMNPFSGKPIYSIDWYGKHIFVCSDDKIAVYDWSNKNRDPYLLPHITSASSVSVKGLLLLLGTQKGEMIVYKRTETSALDFKLRSRVQICNKYISEISWSRLKPLYIAISSLSKNINILKLSPEDNLVIERVLPTISGDACVKWSNQRENYLLSCGFDGVVRIWDLDQPANEPIYFKQFHCPMLCGIFCPLNDNIVICAGKATSLEMFDITKKSSSKVCVSMWKKSKDKPLEGVQWATKMKIHSKSTASKDRKKAQRRRRASLRQDSKAEEAEIEEIQNMMKELKATTNLDSSSAFPKYPNTILYLTTKEGNKDTIQALLSVLEDEDSSDNANADNQKTYKLLSKKLFGTKQEAQEILNEELQNHRSSNTKSIGQILIPQIAGNLKDEILSCIQNKKLTELHVSLAPSISYGFWQKCSIAYAHQLMEVGEVLQATLYFLASRNVKETIDQLLIHNYYREALVIARIHREPDDPIIGVILDKWINQLEINGNLETATLICTLAERYEEAHSLMLKRRNPTEEQLKAINLLSKRLKSK